MATEIPKLSRQARSRQRARQWRKDFLKDKKCVRCGCEDSRLQEFDHIGPKKMTISNMISNGYSVQALEKEAQNTQILCVVCHRLKTVEEEGHYK